MSNAELINALKSALDVLVRQQMPSLSIAQPVLPVPIVEPIVKCVNTGRPMIDIIDMNLINQVFSKPSVTDKLKSATIKKYKNSIVHFLPLHLTDEESITQSFTRFSISNRRDAMCCLKKVLEHADVDFAFDVQKLKEICNTAMIMAKTEFDEIRDEQQPSLTYAEEYMNKNDLIGNIEKLSESLVKESDPEMLMALAYCRVCVIDNPPRRGEYWNVKMSSNSNSKNWYDNGKFHLGEYKTQHCLGDYEFTVTPKTREILEWIHEKNRDLTYLFGNFENVDQFYHKSRTFWEKVVGKSIGINNLRKMYISDTDLKFVTERVALALKMGHSVKEQQSSYTVRPVVIVTPEPVIVASASAPVIDSSASLPEPAVSGNKRKRHAFTHDEDSLILSAYEKFHGQPQKWKKVKSDVGGSASESSIKSRYHYLKKLVSN